MKEVYSNCYTCGKDLVEGQTIVTVHQYYYCNTICLSDDLKSIELGKSKEGNHETE